VRTMKLALIATCLIGSAALARAQAGACKVGIIHVQNALGSTKEGQKAAADIESRVVAPKRKDFEARQAEIQNLQAQLQKGGDVMAANQKDKLTRDIDQKSKALTRDAEDAKEAIEQEQGKALQTLGGKMLQLLEKYAKENGYCVILDVSSQQTPVLFATSEIDVTKDIVDLYDKSAPAGAAATPAAPAATPAPKPPAPKPTSPLGTPPTKKP
jgi:outer membrane protein